MKDFGFRAEASNGGFPIWGIFRGSLAGALTAVVLAFIFTAVALIGEDPDKLIELFAYAALGVGAFLSGFFSPKKELNPILASALSGGGYALIVWLASIPFRKDGTSELSPIISLILYIACVIVAVLAGVIFTPRRKAITVGKKNPAAVLRKQLGR